MYYIHKYIYVKHKMGDFQHLQPVLGKVSKNYSAGEKHAY